MVTNKSTRWGIALPLSAIAAPSQEEIDVSEAFVPRKVFFTKGVGKHRTRLQSFELALRDAGIEVFNLVRETIKKRPPNESEGPSCQPRQQEYSEIPCTATIAYDPISYSKLMQESQKLRNRSA